MKLSPITPEVAGPVRGPRLRGPGVVVLVGLMGSGKSTAGLRLARLLDCEFVDVDERICSETNRSVQEIFAAGGEEEFRRFESDVLESVLNESLAQIAVDNTNAVVVATGGGAVVSAANRAKIVAAGSHVIWLDAKVDALVERTAKGATDRPLLQLDAHKTLEHLSGQRALLYDQIATSTIDTTDLSLEMVVDAIARVVCPPEA